MLVHAIENGTETGNMIHDIDSSIFRISKIDGKILDYVELPSNDINLSIVHRFNEALVVAQINSKYVAKCSDGFLVSNVNTDTVYLYGKDKSLTPMIYKTPKISNLDPVTVLLGCMDAGNYQYMAIETFSRYMANVETFHQYMDNRNIKNYMRDKKNDEVYRQKFILPDYNGKEFFITPLKKSFIENNTQIFFELNLFELKQAYKDKKINGKLKELVATLDENVDNNVFMFINFK